MYRSSFSQRSINFEDVLQGIAADDLADFVGNAL
jgi:hypothetical protein